MLYRIFPGVDWLSADDRLIATALDILDEEAETDE